MKSVDIVLIAGDGIGPEITEAMKQVVEKTIDGKPLQINWIPAAAGMRAIDVHGIPLPAETLDLIREHRLAIKGPTETPTGGGHRSVNVELRQKLNLYANVRPIKWFEGIDAPVRRPEDVDLVIFRENTEDVYAGIEYSAGSDEAKKLHDFLHLPDTISPDSAFGIKPVSEEASRRLMRKAIAYAKDYGREQITIVHKGNIMKFTEGAFRDWCFDEAKKALSKDSGIQVGERIADAMFQDLLLHPERHDLIVTLNLNGDYLSDASAALVGGLGMAPGMNLGDEIALFEAVHGTAPDIAGKDLANPSALILSAALLFQHIGEHEMGQRIQGAVMKAIQNQQVTGDLVPKGSDIKPLRCSEYLDVLLSYL